MIQFIKLHYFTIAVSETRKKVVSRNLKSTRN